MWRKNIMCDVRKYSDMFNYLKTLQPEDTLQLFLEAKYLRGVLSEVWYAAF